MSWPRREVGLALVSAAFVLTAAIAVSLAPYARANGWQVAVPLSGFGVLGLAVGWALCFALALVVLRRVLPGHDPYLLPLAYLLTGWGLIIIWRLAPQFALRQVLWLAVGTLAMLALMALPADLRWLRRYRYLWLLGGLALTALTLLFGVNPSGGDQRRWLGIGASLYLQPAELLKILLVVFCAAYLADRRELLFQTRAGSGAGAPALPYFIPLLLMWGFSMVILLTQRDLGMGMLYFSVFLVMLYLASGHVRYLVIGAALLALSGAIGYALFDLVRLRVDAWWNPWADASGRSFQIVQSLIAIAAGGLGGRGPGLGAPTLIPVAHSDFIFAALAEEWGLVGAAGALGLMAAVVLRGLRIASQAQGAFSQLLGGGLAALLGLQALTIVGGVVKAIPLTGLTLPFGCNAMSELESKSMGQRILRNRSICLTRSRRPQNPSPGEEV
jgi:cell division protein FtsW (lipid II flippase)